MSEKYGVRRDGSYYSRIKWCSHTESDPTFWICNLISDDTERNGGTWGAHTMGPANVVLDFFGEEQEVGKIRIFRNVGITISILEELCKTINVYYNDTDEPNKIRRAEDDINSVEWIKAATLTTEKAEGWQEYVLDKPFKAKFVRLEMVENHGTPPEIDWTEMSEVKFYEK